MESRYDHLEAEPRIYKKWEDSGLFDPDVCVEKGVTAKDAEPFTIIMPPPNANGALHAGHAMFVTIEDIMTRYARMRGRKTLWLPGTDHAGFETQVVYERKLEKEGRSRFDMTREELYKEIWEFTQENKGNTEMGLRSLGASCDWSREKFTLDPEIVKTVYGTFKRLSDDGLLYRGKRIVSWCPKHQTSFSDLEIEDVERVDPLYYLQYGPFVIATARPETKFGDKYVVVHPDDKRYAHYKDGQTIDLEWINGPVTATVIKDDVIDMNFGTGAMTITPWHDATDFAIAERHNLPKVQVIDERGKLLPVAGEFAGMKIAEARPKIVEKLREKGLLVKTDEHYKHVVRTCYKCGTVIEPQIKDQWFVRMKPLAERAIKAIEKGEIAFTPEHYKKICLHWLENIIDWNISRQIAWGIPIPAKICDACGEGVVDIDNTVAKCPACGGAVRQDPDTFDTWFSSGQWPFATLGYPDGKDFKTYYPTDVMETAGEIIFFWVTRMIMLGLYATGDVPFRKVYLHGLVLDAKGRKMSKSKGNVIDPLELTKKYGTDALRIALVIGNTPGTSLALSEDRIRGYRNFATKLWNVARFIDINRPEGWQPGASPSYPDMDSQKEIVELNVIYKEVTAHIENFEFHLAGEKLYHYVWHTIADVIVEQEKGKLHDGTPEEKMRSYALLERVFLESIAMLHPFMPFVTEEIWQTFRPGKMLMVEKW
ncbi:MAG TPA: valine--tRNA ligase [Candidatus Paceibacterota bacterium]|nr:valine--tRNA ligase [Candidatus Paceibacterota bacterium]